ncbi:UPF0149 family protein [Pasteurella skyensis]|uniref:UPF0149 family protein n=1 Tax=Phocoenobacter skyensis TaxID=97481 RepID=A0AAJ6N8G7_9PAST|nr:UPF0149 family protein [Pasteurella skyensis]MDP8161989.1 UPF0149 family protein [Pasteurella skyensis]MDP8172145.1 UPF0149 family protein [Pasteurella skyensis]MDP8176507.1 UPF0149 family protein [Pasteurella skyensis]MDP8178395.1 UPF0149 family protein [Pasteurella skyensis]MDP8182849.1 UPF0149 family protein [Pasteurella skyensis]
MAIVQLKEFKQLISELQIDYSVAEFHGFLSGLVVGGIQDESWKTLTYQMTNDGHSFSQIPLQKLVEVYAQLTQGFKHSDTFFSLWLPSDKTDVFAIADSIAEWTGHFLLGLGLAQPQLQKEINEVGEAIDDLNEISKLGYDEQDNPTELLEATEEIIGYLRVVSLFLYNHFVLSVKHTDKKQLH